VVKKEGFPALYKGLGAVLAGIIPKMAIRFWSFEYYKQLLTPSGEKPNTRLTFIGKKPSKLSFSWNNEWLD
jgi:solute carrier family 25 citrate transporter 1